MHVLKPDEARERHLDKPRAAVMVELAHGELVVVAGSVTIAKPDVLWARLPDRLRVVDGSGKPIKASDGRAFYISTETFNPCHLLMEHEPWF